MDSPFASISDRFNSLTQCPTPWLGMGCHAFGGSVTPSISVRALSEAWEQGVFYFDIARSYGYGQAEPILGQFLRTRRDRAIIATKIGENPQSLSPLNLWIRQRMTRAIRRVLRYRRSRVTDSFPREPQNEPRGRSYSIDEVERSLKQSLRSLGTDYVDILHLHSVAASSVTDELVAKLQHYRESGAVRFLGLATSVRETNAILKDYDVFDIVQIRDSIQNQEIDDVQPAGRDFSLVTHSVLGRSGVFRRQLLKFLVSHPAKAEAISATLGSPVSSPAGIVRLLLGCALQRNSTGTVICGMNQPRQVRNLVEAHRSFLPGDELLRTVNEQLAPLLGEKGSR